MTKSHDYRVSKGNYFYIDSNRVSRERFDDSIKRSNRIKTQFRYRNGTIGAIVVPEAKEIQREIRREVEAPPTEPRRFIIRGIGRPKGKRESKHLVSDHFVETTERIGNIDRQEESLNEKYPSFVHFDTYIEDVE